jgi:hypothetical protein
VDFGEVVAAAKGPRHFAREQLTISLSHGGQIGFIPSFALTLQRSAAFQSIIKYDLSIFQVLYLLPYFDFH